MEKQKFGIIDYNAKKTLKITCSQYLYLYAISKMDSLDKYDRWCIANNQYFADLLDISVRAVQKMSNTMVESGLLIKGKGSKKRVTDKFRLALLTTNKVHPKHEQSSPFTTNKVHPKHEQSSPNNNSISIEDKNKINKKDSLFLKWKTLFGALRSRKGVPEKRFKALSLSEIDQLFIKTKEYLAFLDVVKWRDKKTAEAFLNKEFWNQDWVEQKNEHLKKEGKDQQPKQAKTQNYFNGRG